MSFKPEDLTEISMHDAINEHFIINIIDKDKQEAFLIEKIGSAVMVEQVKQVILNVLGEIEVWHSDYFEEWEVAECTYQDAFFLYPSGENMTHVISDAHTNYDEKQWADKRYVVQEDDTEAMRLDSKTLGMIISALAFEEAGFYQGYSFDTKVMLDLYHCKLISALDDAKYGLYGDDDGAELDSDVKYSVERLVDALEDCLYRYGELY